MKKHHYDINLIWTGNRGDGTTTYKSYDRDYTVSVVDKPDILCSSDPAFLGDPKRYNPEEMLVASLSSCHMLWYLHLCAQNNIVVISYDDKASGVMAENVDGSGQFSEVVLSPVVSIRDAQNISKAVDLHHDVKKYCFIARSVNFVVKVVPEVVA